MQIYLGTPFCINICIKPKTLTKTCMYAYVCVCVCVCMSVCVCVCAYLETIHAYVCMY